MNNKLFYRVANIETNQGLWYDYDGSFTGLIHTKFNFCASSELPMPYDSELFGWISATDDLEKLWFWFTKEDVYKLQSHGWYVYAFLATDWKMYSYDDKISHTVIDKTTSIPFMRIEINDSHEIGNIYQLKSPQKVAI
jgi:hypothetical protein